MLCRCVPQNILAKVTWMDGYMQVDSSLEQLRACVSCDNDAALGWGNCAAVLVSSWLLLRHFCCILEEVESNRKEKHNIIIVVPVSKSGVPKLKLNSGPKAKGKHLQCCIVKMQNGTIWYTPWEASEEKVKSGLNCFLSCRYDLRTGEYYDLKFHNLLT